MIYITKQEGLYQNKVNSSLVSTCNCKMDYWLYSILTKHVRYLHYKRYPSTAQLFVTVLFTNGLLYNNMKNFVSY